MLEKLFHLISFIGAVQGVLLAAVFLTIKGNHPATKALAAYTFIFSIGLLEPYLVETLTGWIRTPILNFLTSSNLLYGPLLYLFVFYLTSREPHSEKRQILHFVPFFILIIATICFSFAGVELLAIDLILFLAFELLIVQILTYNIMSVRRLVKHQQVVVDVYSNLHTGDLKWLRSLLILITAIYLLSFIISHLLVLGFESARALYLLVQLAITFTIYMMTYRLILQPQLFMLQITSHIKRDGENVLPKYLKSGLKPDQAEEYLQLLTDCMQKEKPYLDPSLNIYTLSEKLNISRNHLTQVINEKLDKNFYTYINEHRVEEAKKKLHDPKLSYLNLAGIGFEAGFKSKTAFNINFKKITGLTPTEWKKEAEKKTFV